MSTIDLVVFVIAVLFAIYSFYDVYKKNKDRDKW
jgi:Na+/proline symporter